MKLEVQLFHARNLDRFSKTRVRGARSRWGRPQHPVAAAQRKLRPLCAMDGRPRRHEEVGPLKSPTRTRKPLNSGTTALDAIIDRSRRRTWRSSSTTTTLTGACGWRRAVSSSASRARRWPSIDPRPARKNFPTWPNMRALDPNCRACSRLGCAASTGSTATPSPWRAPRLRRANHSAARRATRRRSRQLR